MKNFPNAITLPNSNDLNLITFNDYYFRLKMMAQAVFEWKGLPKLLSEKYIEKYLFDEGKCVFFKDNTLGWMVTRYVGEGNLNHYDMPTKINPVCPNYTQAESRILTPDEDCALIWNNDCAIPSHFTVLQSAARLTEIKRTIDINIEAQKTPITVVCTDKQRLSMSNAYKQRKTNQPLIVVDKSLEGIELFKVMKSDAPVVFPDLRIELRQEWNDAMTALGINNANQDKRERLVADEVAANDEQVARSAATLLKARREAAQRMSELYGEEITCDIRNCSEALEGLQSAVEVIEREGVEE